MRVIPFATALVVALAAAPAMAENRDLCPERPGLNTPACTVEPGAVVVETAFADWTRDDSADAREDTLLIGDTVVRIGATERLEVQLGWTPFGHDYVRDRLSGDIATANRVGDMFVAAKLNLAHPDGSGFALALKPTLTLPVGRTPIGAGDWGFDLAFPASWELGKGVSLAATPAISAAVDGDGHGRHLAYGSAAGVQLDVTDAISLAIEAQVTRDDDPAEPSTQSVAGLAVAWQPSKRLQFDLGSVVGLNRDTPDIELYAGIARKF